MTYTAQFNLTDHLGNVRSVVNSSGTVLQSTDYYPFGLAFSDNNIASNRYLYNGKELENYTLGTAYLGTLDYGARHYDPRIARWTVPDPLAEKYYGVNAYNYCGNSPTFLIDPDGQFPETVWDIANLILDVQSLVDNLKQRKVGASIVDGVGLIVDAAAAALPFVPGGAGTAIKGVRTAGKAADAVKTVDIAIDGVKVVNKADEIQSLSRSTEAITEQSSRAARREVMRKEGIPTSIQPKSQMKNESGFEYRYDFPDSYGNIKEKICSATNNRLEPS